MSQTLEEYEAMDFGFSAVDEAEVKETASAKVVTNEDLKELLEKIGLDLELLYSEVTSTNIVNEVEADQKDVVDSYKYKEKLEELEKIIMPLLANLMKTADKEYIKWPNRGPQVQATIDKVLSITRS